MKRQKTSGNEWKSAERKIEWRHGHGTWLQVKIGGKLFIMREVSKFRELGVPQTDPLEEGK